MRVQQVSSRQVSIHINEHLELAMLNFIHLCTEGRCSADIRYTARHPACCFHGDAVTCWSFVSPLVGRLNIVAEAISVRRNVARHLSSGRERLCNSAHLSVLMQCVYSAAGKAMQVHGCRSICGHLDVRRMYALGANPRPTAHRHQGCRYLGHPSRRMHTCMQRTHLHLGGCKCCCQDFAEAA